MPVILDQLHQFFGGMYLSSVGRGQENVTDERVPVNTTNAASRRQTQQGGRATGGVEIPLYDLTANTAKVVAQWLAGTEGVYIVAPSVTADTLAFLNRASPLTAGNELEDNVLAMRNLMLKFSAGAVESSGLNMYTQVGGSGVAAPANGTSITFPALTADKSLLVSMQVYAVTGTGNFDASIASAPDATYVGKTTRHTFTQVAHTAVPAEQFVLINGAITDPEWRLEINTISGGTWFVHVAAAQITEL